MKRSAAIGSCIMALSVSALASEPGHGGPPSTEDAVHVQPRLSSNDRFGSTTSLLGIALMDFIVDWLTLEYDLPPTEVLPTVTLVPVSHLITMRYGPQPASPATEHAGVAAVYHDQTRTIFLPEGWTGRTPGELSLLVHELVHHVQNVAQIEYGCPEAREKPAYAAQERWLTLSGTDLAGEFGIDPMTLLVRTHCFH